MKFYQRGIAFFNNILLLNHCVAYKRDHLRILENGKKDLSGLDSSNVSFMGRHLFGRNFAGTNLTGEKLKNVVLRSTISSSQGCDF